jgi:hypothetical protein
MCFVLYICWSNNNPKKNENMKNIRLYILTLILSGIFISCSTSRHNASAYSSEPIMEQTSSDLFSTKNDKSLYYTKTIERKINFSAFLSLIVDKPDTANVHIENIAKKYNGYINEIGTYRTIIRVNSENLDAAIKEISALGKVKSKNILGQDVTEEYSDYQIRLDNAEKARKRYLELLAKAEDVQATLKVEKELERLNELLSF